MSDSFSRVMLSLDGPAVVVTASDGRELGGCLVGFCTQTSIEPERFLVCVSKRNHTHSVALRSAALAVHIIPADRMDLARRFGSQTDDDPGTKFAGLVWKAGFGGAPLLRDCPSKFAGPILRREDLGDHTGFLIEPTDVAFAPGRVLGLADVKDLSPGHEP